MGSSNEKPNKLLWDSPSFAKMYKTAEKITKLFGADLLRVSGLEIPPSQVQLRVLDMACGTGAISSLIQEDLKQSSAESIEILCLDIADAMLDVLRSRIETESWSHTTIVKADAQDTKLSSNSFDYTFNNFGPMNVPNPPALVAECYRIIKPGGTCCFSTWDTIGWIPDICDAMKSIPDIPLPPAHAEIYQKLAPGEWHRAEFVRKELVKQGFVEVEVETVHHAITGNLEDLKATIGGTLSIITSRHWTEEQRKKFEGPELNDRVLEFLKMKYSNEAMVWNWVAILAKGKKQVS